MAYILELKTNAQGISATYPYGNIKDDTGVADGVPVNTVVYADFHQFFARLIDQASNPAVVINNQADNAVNGFQYYEALLATKTTLGIANEAQININTPAIAANVVAILELRKRVIASDFSTF
jgi:hypothetical protein